MNIKKVAVIGAGVMGSGIAQVFAMAGFDVVIYDIKTMACERAIKSVKKSLDKFLKKNVITKTAYKHITNRISTTTNIEDLADADFVIEAATENIDIKKEIFKKLDLILRKDVVIATNTSAISIKKLASVTKRPSKIIGMHFMNPVPLIKGVEIIKSEKTDNKTEGLVVDLAIKLGKTVVRSNDVTGFISNRVLMPMINEAVYALHDGVASKEDIDECMVSCLGFPMGPLAMADLIGLDTVRSILKVMYEGLDDPKFKPCPLINEMVRKGYLGRKSGRGFYEY